MKNIDTDIKKLGDFSKMIEDIILELKKQNSYIDSEANAFKNKVSPNQKIIDDINYTTDFVVKSIWKYEQLNLRILEYKKYCEEVKNKRMI